MAIPFYKRHRSILSSKERHGKTPSLSAVRGRSREGERRCAQDRHQLPTMPLFPLTSLRIN